MVNSGDGDIGDEDAVVDKVVNKDVREDKDKDKNRGRERVIRVKLLLVKTNLNI